MRSSSSAARGIFAIVLASTLAAVPALASAQDDPASKPKPKTDDNQPAPGNDQPAKTDDGKPGNGTPVAAPAKTDDGAPDGGAAPAGGTTAADEVPINLRLRRLEQRVQALKERAWRAKARVGMLKEAVLGGGIGARATVLHKNNMGNSFRLVKLVYALDGTQIFARSDESGGLHKNKTFDVLTGPIAPGSHTISVLAVYRGHGYGVFKYLKKYRFTVRSSHTFTASEGKATRVEAKAFERGGVTTPLEKRPAIDFKVSHSTGAK